MRTKKLRTASIIGRGTFYLQASLNRMSVQQNGEKKRNRFTIEEDNKLKELVYMYGENMWEVVAKNMPQRNARQVRDRWTNFLSPKITKEPWNRMEDDLLIRKINEFGTKWVLISQFFPHRSDTAIKNRWLILQKLLLAKKMRAERQLSYEKASDISSKAIEEMKDDQKRVFSNENSIFQDFDTTNDFSDFFLEVDSLERDWL